MNRWIYVALLAVGLIAGGGWLLTQSGGAPGQSEIAAGDGLNLAGAANAQTAEVDTSGIVEMELGNPDAAVEVIEYASYTCPHCANFHGTVYDQLKADYIDTGKIRFVYREVYFDKYGVWASLIARCAGPDKFFGITDLIYDGQSTWARAGSDAAIAGELRKIGLLAGIEQADLEACLSDGDKVKALVAWYQQNAEADGVRSTPSFVIDGTLYQNMAYSEFQEILNDRLGE